MTSVSDEHARNQREWLEARAATRTAGKTLADAWAAYEAAVQREEAARRKMFGIPPADDPEGDKR